MSSVRGARVSAAGLVIALLLCWGCADRPSFDPGEECELNTECAAPLVCRLGRCRIECRAQRDCYAGLDCVRDEARLGACQLPDEATCTLASECPDFLVCRFGRCTNACETNVDCPPGSRCEDDGTGMFGCRDQAGRECLLNSDCEEVQLICAPDGHCREPCRNNRDCRDGTVCETTTSPTACVFPEDLVDAGVDGGRMDGGTTTDAGVDGGTDAGDMDGGGDAGADAGADADTDADPMMVSPPDLPLMAGGEGHACATRGGVAHCWGPNDRGQVGNGRTRLRPPLESPEPVVALPLTAVTAMGVGAGHSCAIRGDALFCWGDNSSGQLGQGSVGGTLTSPTSVAIGLSGPATDVALGNAHTCVIDAARLFCWGANGSGQLGRGMFTPPSGTPVEVGLTGTPVQVATFSNHTCVRLDDGSVRCFGENGSGEVGNGTTGTDVPSPGLVVGLGTAIHVATGSTHSCAIESDGTVKCWGNDAFGQRGDGGGGLFNSGTAMPTIALGEPALQLALGSAHTCAVTATSLQCWGDNSAAQVGQERITTFQVDSPRAVTSVGMVEEVAAGSFHTCVRDALQVRCWGEDTDGQLGDGVSRTPDHTPYTVMWP